MRFTIREMWNETCVFLGTYRMNYDVIIGVLWNKLTVPFFFGIAELGSDEQNGNPPAQSYRTISSKRLHYWKPFLWRFDGKIKTFFN